MKRLTFMILGLIFLGSCQPPAEQPSEAPAIQEPEVSQTGPEKITFPSLDSLLISAHVYHLSDDAPIILLCHQAGYNKFEYEGIAQQLNELGFNCIAIDQRSGGPIVDHSNETTLRAVAEGLSTDYLDAEQDILAAIRFAAQKYDRKVILWGSSYSATLALYLAIEQDLVGAVISFSPGDYFKDQKGSLVEKLSGFKKPMFVTSSKREEPGIEELVNEMQLTDHQLHFIPEGAGHHGSRALWKDQRGGEEYWTAIRAFLTGLKATDI